MVRTVLNAKTKQNKISLSTISQTVPLVANSDQQKIVVYPNFRISQGNIHFNQYRPDNETKTVQDQEFTFESEKEIIKMASQEGGIDRVKVSQVIKAVCQLLLVHISSKHLPADKPSSSKELRYQLGKSQSTGLLIYDGSEYLIYTALHCIAPEEGCSHHQVFVSFCEEECIDSVNLIMSSVSQKNQNLHYQSIDQLICDLYPRLMKSKAHYMPVEIDCDFLRFRKNWLASLQTTNFVNDVKKYPIGDEFKLLDPIYSLKPLPAVDFTILKVDSSLLNEEQRLKFLKKEQAFSDLNPSESLIRPSNLELIGIIGFNDVHGQIEFKKVTNAGQMSTIYDKTLIIPKGDDVSIDVERFFYKGKTISFGKLYGYNNQFISFEASTIEGSSGGPIITSDGKVIGLSISYFEDLTTYASCTKKTDILRFDVDSQELVASYELSKNQNLAINFQHPCLKSYFQVPKGTFISQEELPFLSLKTVFESNQSNQDSQESKKQFKKPKDLKRSRTPTAASKSQKEPGNEKRIKSPTKEA